MQGNEHPEQGSRRTQPDLPMRTLACLLLGAAMVGLYQLLPRTRPGPDDVERGTALFDVDGVKRVRCAKVRGSLHLQSRPSDRERDVSITGEHFGIVLSKDRPAVSHVEVDLISGFDFGDWRDRVSTPDDVPCFVTAEEQITWGGINSFSRWDQDLVRERTRQDMRGKELGLISHFLKVLRARAACRCSPINTWKALRSKNHRVTGVVMRSGEYAATGGRPARGNNISEPAVRVQHLDRPALHNKITLVHSFHTLLGDLATLTRNVVRLGRDRLSAVLATPTRTQHRALDRLQVSPTADRPTPLLQTRSMACAQKRAKSGEASASAASSSCAWQC